jgi:predicted phage tail component-like protein
MTTNGFTFNGVHSSKYFTVNKIIKSITPLITPRLLIVPNKKGAYDQGIETGIGSFDHTVTLFADSIVKFEQLKKEIASWLITEELAPLVYDSDPNVTHYVRFSGKLTLDEMYTYGDSGTITFISPDPDGYGPEATSSIPAGGLIFINEGTTETFPKFKATINQSITFLDIVTPDDYIRIGNPVTVEEVEVSREQSMINDDCGSTVGWGAATEVDGTVTGTMASDGVKFYASDYGTGTGWHGPALKQSLTETLQDFMVEVWLTQKSTSPDQVGRAEFYLLDDLNNAIGKMALKDWMKDTHLNYGEARIGGTVDGKHIINYAGNHQVWNDFYGILRMIRIGNEWSAYIGKYDINTGKHHARLVETYKDIDGKFTKPLAQIVVHLGAQGTYTPTTQSIDKVKVWKINPIQAQEVPYIAQAGDIIELDHSKALILKNGEPFLDEKDFASNFFSLGKGETEIKVVPSNAASVEMVYRPRWL